MADLCSYDTRQGDNCQWECSDVPGLFYCTKCDRLRQWDTFAQNYLTYAREGHYA